MTPQEFIRVNYALHESGHMCGALHRRLRCDAAIGFVLTELGQASAMTWHYGGVKRDDLFILACGIAASRYFQLGEAGARKDLADIAAFKADRLTKRQAQVKADAYVAGHFGIILKMAYRLCVIGRLDQATTQGIFDGTMEVVVPKAFHSALDQIAQLDWNGAS